MASVHVGLIDARFAPVPSSAVTPVLIGDETVLIDGWRHAIVLDPSARMLWNRFDGVTPLGQIAGGLCDALGFERTAVERDAVALARHLGELGILAGVAPTPHAVVEGEPPKTMGDFVDDTTVVDAYGMEHLLSDTVGDRALVVYWSAQCGYCASITRRLTALAPLLREVGAPLTVLALGDADDNQAILAAVGDQANVLLLQDRRPFPGAGTPAAYVLNRGLRIEDAAWGTSDVIALAASLAGTDEMAPLPAGGARYLLESDGLCEAAEVRSHHSWVTSRVLKIGDYHVGFRCGSEETAETLQRLFCSPPIDDDQAGFSYSIHLESSGGEALRGVRRLSQLTGLAGYTLTSTGPYRVVQALLWDLHEKINQPGGASSRSQVRAVAALHASGLVLLPTNLRAFGRRLEAKLARHGLLLADAPFPEVDFDTHEVVLPEPLIHHDPDTLESLKALSGATSMTHHDVGPGRYPLAGWGVVHPSESMVTTFTPAQAAAATLSLMVGAGDPASRVRQLGDLFAAVPGFGYWYHTENELVAAISEALGP